MAKADVTVVGGASVTPVLTFSVDDLDTSTLVTNIQPGEPCKRSTDFATLLLTGEPTYTTTVATFIGIATSTGTATDTAEGTVDIATVVPFVTILRAKATTAANIDTAAKLQAFSFNAVSFDGISALTGSTTTTPYTIDEDQTDDPNDTGLVILGGDVNKGTLDVFVKPLSTIFGNSV